MKKGPPTDTEDSPPERTPPQWRKVRNCIACDSLFEPRRPDHVKCKPNCGSYSAWEKKTPEEREQIKRNSLLYGALAAAYELRVACDLLAKGWQVCRPFSPTCPFDLIAWRVEEEEQRETVIKLQVKTAQLKGDRYICGPIRNNHHDVLVLVTPDSLIYVSETPIITLEVRAGSDTFYRPVQRTRKEKIPKPRKEPLPPDKMALNKDNLNNCLRPPWVRTKPNGYLQRYNL